MKKLWEEITNHPDIPKEHWHGVYHYLFGYLLGLPRQLKRSLGTEKEIMDRFVKQGKDSITIDESLERLKWFDKPFNATPL